MTTTHIGALIVSIGFGGPYTITIIRNPQNSIGNYLGYISRASRHKFSGLIRWNGIALGLNVARRKHQRLGVSRVSGFRV